MRRNDYCSRKLQLLSRKGTKTHAKAISSSLNYTLQKASLEKSLVCLFYKVSKPTNILSKILLQKKALQIFLCFAFLANIFFKFFFIKVALLKDSSTGWVLCCYCNKIDGANQQCKEDISRAGGGEAEELKEAA